MELGTQLLILFLFALYMIPTWIAERRKHKNKGAILVVNLLSGWIFGIGWIIALVWALTSPHTDKEKADMMAESMAAAMLKMKQLEEANK